MSDANQFPNYEKRLYAQPKLKQKPPAINEKSLNEFLGKIHNADTTEDAYNICLHYLAIFPKAIAEAVLSLVKMELNVGTKHYTSIDDKILRVSDLSKPEIAKIILLEITGLPNPDRTLTFQQWFSEAEKGAEAFERRIEEFFSCF